jgi:Saccharopine dehydrogenase NADP binding domain
MSKILILGGTGYTGKPLARLLLEHSQAVLTLAARRLEKAQALADELNQHHPGGRVSALHADAADVDSLRAAFRGQDMVVVASPTTAYAANVVRAALAAGADYLDVQLGTAKFALLQSLAGEIKDAGRCFITEAGFHPGLPAALVRYAASFFDTLESATTVGYLNMGRNLPYIEAVSELVEMFKDYQSQVYKAGQWTKSSSFDTRRIDLGGDLGKKLCYSMFFEELRPLPEMYPSLKDVGFYISESHWMVDWVIYPLAWMWLKLMPKAVGPIGRLLWWGMGTFHRPPERVELQVHASGIKAGKPLEIRASVAHPDGYELTAIPVAAALLQYLDGSARKPGVWMMGHLAEPLRLMKDMETMGARVETRVAEKII